MTTVRVGDISPNPFRDIDNYPINETKIEELMASYQTTRVWPNVIARGTTDLGVEIAYGHHRVEAAKRLFGEDYEFPLIIEDLSDDEMFKMMASENMDVYAASAMVVQNTIESLVKGYAEGKLHLDKPTASEANASVRSAPSFLRSASSTRRRFPYTAETLRAYLGWTSLAKVKSALVALETIEQGTMEREDFEGLTMDQARGVIETVHHAERAATASHRKRPTRDVVAVTREVAVRAAKSGEGRYGIRSTGQQVIEREAPIIRKQPPPEKTVRRLSSDISNFWKQSATGSVPPTSREAILKLIAANRNSPTLLALGHFNLPKQIAHDLREMAATATKFADLISDDTTLEVTA